MSSNILIYANKVARPSETFIFFPALAMQKYTPYFVGSRRGDAFNLPEERVFIANGSGTIARVKQRLTTTCFGHNGVPFLAEKLRPLQPRLIQAHFGPESINALPLAKRLGIPLIVYYHGIDATMTREYAANNRFLRRYLRMLPRLHSEATLVLTQSNFLRDRVIDYWGYPPEKVRTQYIGVEPTTETPLPLEEREPIVLFVARLVEKKGATYLIKAMQTVQEKHPDLELVIAGDGADYDQLYEQANNQLRKFRFVGWQSTAEVEAWMRRALIFSVPSITAQNGDSEGFGMVFIEAQRSGTPVVSTQHGGIVESVAHDKTGILVPERDADSLAKAIIQVYEDRRLWQQFSNAAYERVQHEFDIHMLVARLEGIYDELITGVIR